MWSSSEILKQIWDLSDQDSDSMLSLREFCVALYLMERYREGQTLPPVLPNSVMLDETLLTLAGPPTAYGNMGWSPAAGIDWLGFSCFNLHPSNGSMMLVFLLIFRLKTTAGLDWCSVGSTSWFKTTNAASSFSGWWFNAIQSEKCWRSYNR